MPAGDVERHDDAIARLDMRHVRADLLDDPHWLVTEDIALLHVHRQHPVEVQIRTADSRRGDPHDRVGRLLDHRIGHLVNAHVFRAVPHNCLHLDPLLWLPRVVRCQADSETCLPGE
jgi:hypothetical protein